MHLYCMLAPMKTVRFLGVLSPITWSAPPILAATNSVRRLLGLVKKIQKKQNLHHSIIQLLSAKQLAQHGSRHKNYQYKPSTDSHSHLTSGIFAAVLFFRYLKLKKFIISNRKAVFVSFFKPALMMNAL